MRLKVAWKVEKDDAILVVKSILSFNGSKANKLNSEISRTPPAAPAGVIAHDTTRTVFAPIIGLENAVYRKMLTTKSL